jgi:hypothetical protein
LFPKIHPETVAREFFNTIDNIADVEPVRVLRLSMFRAWTLLPFLSGMIVVCQCCAGPQEAFQNVQLCIADERGVLELKRIMQAVAQSKNLVFIDNSARQGENLKAMGADKALGRDASRAIDVHIEGENGMGVTAGNLGLPEYQVALAFTEGTNPSMARVLSNELIKALSQRWHVEVVLLGKGAMPMKTCEG